MSPRELITLLLTASGSNISRASITASPSRWLLSRHALLRALRRPAEKCLRAAGVLPAQPPGNQDRALLHRLHRPAGVRHPSHQPAQGLRRSGPTRQDLDGLVLW